MIRINDDLGLICKKCGELWEGNYAVCPLCGCEEVEPVFIQDTTEIHELIHELVENDYLTVEIRNRIIDYLRELLPSG